MPHRSSIAIALLVMIGGGACTIVRHVDPVPPTTIASLCIVENDAVWSKQFLPTLRDQLTRHGIASTVYDRRVPPECDHWLEYEARWQWDVAVYLAYADIRVYQGTTLVGR